MTRAMLGNSVKLAIAQLHQSSTAALCQVRASFEVVLDISQPHWFGLTCTLAFS